MVSPVKGRPSVNHRIFPVDLKLFLLELAGGHADVADALGRVVHGHGNDGASGYEGCRWNNVVGTYIHGPLLPKNPELADWLLARALERQGASCDLAKLDDSQERAANAVMVSRMEAGEA